MNLDRMANDYTCDHKLIEISKRLEECHLAYLQIDDSPQKIEQRRKLEGIIEEFLCLVPHGNKYVFQETGNILHRSAATLQDFSGYRACTAWSAIALYAANLLAQPWRKEYRTLRTYSGYYKHEVETNLVGAELMFELMGYKHTSIGVMTLETPIDPDKVSNVSRDAIVAFVECQILKKIWEAVSKNYSISITWLEVLKFRESFVRSPEQAIRALNYRCLEKIKRNHPLGYCNVQPLMADIMSQGHHPYNMGVSNYNVPLVQPCQWDYQCMDDGTLNRHAMYPINNGFENRCNTYAHPMRGNKYGQTSGPMYPHVMSTHCRVPTGQLIELDTPNYEKAYNGKAQGRSPEYDEIDSFTQYAGSGDRREYGKTEKKPSKLTNPHKENDWDYVFQNLKSQGYSKDLGDRDDILHQKMRDSESRPSKHKNLKAYLEAEEKYARHQEKEKPSRAYVEEVEGYSNRSLNNKESSKKIPISDVLLTDLKMESDLVQEKVKKNNRVVPNQSKGVTEIMESMKEVGIIGEKVKKDEDANKWNCASCTYLNVQENSICEMCNKSRHKGNEDTPLASGGKECPKCTLINERDSSKCIACDTSLEDSPTYI